MLLRYTNLWSSKAVNIEKEQIELASASTAAVGDFTRVIPDDTPRYSFFLFNRRSSPSVSGFRSDSPVDVFEGQQESPIGSPETLT